MKRVKCTTERDHHFTGWFMLSFAIATTILALIVAVGSPVGTTLFSHLINMIKLITINAILFSIWTVIVAILFSFMYIPVPRLFAASLSYTFIFASVMLIIAESGTLFSWVIGIIYSLLFLLIGFIFIILFRRTIHPSIKMSILAILLVPGSIFLLFDQIDLEHQSIPAIAEQTKDTLHENPASQGMFDYSFFSYGSGQDLHRTEFGHRVDQITPTVDASDFITTWSKSKEKFWGFDPAQLPVNGRVWMPEGEGPLPVILMVHGNHTMEYLSTGGYDYLGELLASRGFIAISVDQDFINFSSRYGSPNDNYELRTWMLLQHLAQLQQLNEKPGSFLYEKIDLQQVGLVGHSRGGQAVLMAEDRERFIDDVELLESIESIDIKGIVSVAPTDKLINGERPSIHNVSYLLLHGARDADVSSFRDQPFYRATFDTDDDGFKTSLYIEGANHTHFNSDWGSMDLSFPRGIFLNQKGTLTPKEQQQVAKVYVSAFFESVFHGQDSYAQLFLDHRYGEHWLPDTTLVNKYKQASYQPIITFDQNRIDILETSGFITSEITRPKDRDDKQRSLDALLLEWKNDASYTVDLSDHDWQTSEHLVLTMANADDEPNGEGIPEIWIELATKDGMIVDMPLDDVMPFPPVISTDFTRFGLFEDIFRNERYKNAWEPVFQTFDIPLENFTALNDQFKKEHINRMTLHFKHQPGKIYIEEIGVW